MPCFYFSFSGCRYSPPEKRWDANSRKYVIVPASRKHGCIERFSRCMIHNVNSPSSVGMACTFLLEIQSTKVVHRNVLFRSERLPSHVSWHSGVGITKDCDNCDQLGQFCRLTTGKGSSGEDCFRKAWKQYEALSLVSFVQYPVQNPFGYLAVDVLNMR